MPSAGTFAILPASDEFHQKVKHAFVSIVALLRPYFIRDGQGTSYQSLELETEAAKLDPVLDANTVRLGLYLGQHFGIFSMFGFSENKVDVISFGISENIINLRDPVAGWGSGDPYPLLAPSEQMRE